MKLVQIKCNGEMTDLDIPINTKNIRKGLADKSIHRGDKKLQHLYSWDYEGSIILCYGWINGTAGKENKHDLPASATKLNALLDNSDTQLLFGDIFILMKQGNRFHDFSTSDYGLFYSLCFEGFDDCLSDDYSDDYDDMAGCDTDDTDVDGDGYVDVNTNKSDMDDTSNLSGEYEEELDEDENVY